MSSADYFNEALSGAQSAQSSVKNYLKTRYGQDIDSLSKLTDVDKLPGFGVMDGLNTAMNLQMMYEGVHGVKTLGSSGINKVSSWMSSGSKAGEEGIEMVNFANLGKTATTTAEVTETAVATSSEGFMSYIFGEYAGPAGLIIMAVVMGFIMGGMNAKANKEQCEANNEAIDTLEDNIQQVQQFWNQMNGAISNEIQQVCNNYVYIIEQTYELQDNINQINAEGANSQQQLRKFGMVIILIVFGLITAKFFGAFEQAMTLTSAPITMVFNFINDFIAFILGSLFPAKKK